MAVVAVHGPNLRQRLFYDDYNWLSISDHHGWFTRLITPEGGAAIYRPVLGLWFSALRPVFGSDPFPYHLFALGFLCAAAVCVRWLAREIGLANTPATIAGIVYGANGALAWTTIWASAALSPLAVSFAVGSTALVCRPSARREAIAVILLIAAIATRDAMVITPAVATILLTARRPDGTGIASSLRATRLMWLASAAYVVMRAALGLFGTHNASYAIDFLRFGRVFANLEDLMKVAARFGVPLQSDVEASAARVWDFGLWLLLIGLSLWAARRRSWLPLAGLAWFFVALIPVLGLRNHPMQPYYLELALVGLALTVGSLVAIAKPAPAVAVVAVAVFVLMQVGIVQRIQSRDFLATIIRRTDFLEETSRHAAVTNGVLIIETPCRADKQWAYGSDLFRVLRDEPTLRVKYRFTKPRTSATVNCG
jgi:hypothetical protein